MFKNKLNITCDALSRVNNLQPKRKYLISVKQGGELCLLCVLNQSLLFEQLHFVELVLCARIEGGEPCTSQGNCERA